MTVKKRGLGRGLDALLGGIETLSSAVPAAQSNEGELRRLPVDLIRRGKYQPRVDMHPESLEDLANSIRAQGVVQPIVVKPAGGGQYEIIAGERRWRAAQLAGLQDIPAVIRDVPDKAAMAMALIENIQRENLNPMEEANALQRLISEFQLTHQEVAEAVGRSRAAVSNLLRLLELNDDVKRMLEQGQLEMGHARALLALKGSAQSAAARSVADKGLSVRETERLVRRLSSEAPSKASPARVDPDIRRLQEELSEKLGAGVQVQHGAKGKGKLVIQYNSLDELEGILAHIK
jgi:ParB family chromosome partitioning protein